MRNRWQCESSCMSRQTPPGSAGYNIPKATGRQERDMAGIIEKMFEKMPRVMMAVLKLPYNQF